MGKIIYHSVRLNCSPAKAFAMFTENKHLESWLTLKADVEPKVGGKYELFWNPDNREIDSTIGCKITALEPDKLLSFEWKGPVQYKDFMNDADPLTHVVVLFLPCGEGKAPVTEVHLVHSGWRSSAEWEEARQWFEKMWSGCFKELSKQVNG